MKLLLSGARVSPSRMVDGHGPARCSAAKASVVEVPFAGLARTRAFAAVPSTAGVAGHVSPERVLGDRPGGTAQRTRRQHIDLDPHRPRPCGGCG
jgi:hypothetical protein